MTARRYSGRLFSADELTLVAAITADRTAHPTRAAIARAVCTRLHWLQPDGRLKAMSCYCALRAMERDGLLALPPPANPGGGRPRPVPLTPASARQPRITGSRGDLGPITLRPVTDKAEVALWREVVARWHYLGFRLHGGAQLRYLAWDARGRLLAAMEFSASAWKVAPRDRFLRWTPEQRMARLHLIAGQSTFLILPWVRVKFLASSLLGQVARQLPADWSRRYHYEPVLLESCAQRPMPITHSGPRRSPSRTRRTPGGPLGQSTRGSIKGEVWEVIGTGGTGDRHERNGHESFVDSHRFFGTSYRAAGWRCLGETTGRGRNDRHNRRTHRLPQRWIFIRPLRPDYRAVLRAPLLPPPQG